LTIYDYEEDQESRSEIEELISEDLTETNPGYLSNVHQVSPSDELDWMRGFGDFIDSNYHSPTNFEITHTLRMR